MRFHTTSTEFLSVAEQDAYIATAQDVPVVEDGDSTTYGVTAASEAAFERLVAAFYPAILKAASAAKVIDRDEAEAVALVEFVEAVRRHDPADGVPFSATIATILRFAVKKADRGHDLIKVKNTVAATYWALMYRHEGNFATAYAEVKESANGLTPETFLSVHMIVTGIDTLDPIITDEDSDNGPRHALASAVGSPEAKIALAAEVEWLFTLVGSEEEQILRLAYGFSDLATEKIRLASGYAIGELMSDAQVADALGSTKPTVQRKRSKALSTMRDAIEAAALAERA